MDRHFGRGPAGRQRVQVDAHGAEPGRPHDQRQLPAPAGGDGQFRADQGFASDRRLEVGGELLVERRGGRFFTGEGLVEGGVVGQFVEVGLVAEREGQAVDGGGPGFAGHLGRPGEAAGAHVQTDGQLLVGARQQAVELTPEARRKRVQRRRLPRRGWLGGRAGGRRLVLAHPGKLQRRRAEPDQLGRQRRGRAGAAAHVARHHRVLDRDPGRSHRHRHRRGSQQRAPEQELRGRARRAAPCDGAWRRRARSGAAPAQPPASRVAAASAATRRTGRRRRSVNCSSASAASTGSCSAAFWWRFRLL